jgi:hypothetical protein
MFGRDKIKAITLDDLQSLDLDSVYEKSSSYNSFNANKHDRETRKQITKLFLNWYFWLIILAFLFCLGYNWIIALLNINLLSKGMELIPYIEVSNTVSLITTTLSSGVGFVIGYYFKNDKDNL